MSLFLNNKNPCNTETETSWIKEEHLFGDPTYRCRACGGVFDRPAERCPKCRARVTEIENDPTLVDEIEFFEL